MIRRRLFAGFLIVVMTTLVGCQKKTDLPTPDQSASRTPKPIVTPVVITPTNGAQTPIVKGVTWGMTMNSSPFPAMDDLGRFQEINDAQISTLSPLGVQVVRITWPIETPDRGLWVMKRLKERGFKIFLIVEDYAMGPQPNEHDHGFAFAKGIADYAGEYIDYYQLANEIGGSAIKGAQFPGTKYEHYDPKKLSQTLDFVKGASKAIRASDPEAELVVSINSLHTGIITEAVKRGIDFDILAWNWFSDFGLDLENPVLNQQTGERYAFAQAMRSFKKTLWITELSRRGGVADGNEEAQADFITQAIPKAAEAGFSGIFPFLLVEDVVGLPGYGILVPTKGAGNRWQIDRPRKAYTAYQALIKQSQ